MKQGFCIMPKDVEKIPAKRGRKNHAVTIEKQNLVKLCMASGFNQEDTAKCLTIDLKTLRKYYADQLKSGRVQANVQVVASLFKAACKGNVQAGIYWSKVHMNWRDNSEAATVINIAPQRIEAPVIEGEAIDLDAITKQ